MNVAVGVRQHGPSASYDPALVTSLSLSGIYGDEVRLYKLLKPFLDAWLYPKPTNRALDVPELDKMGEWKQCGDITLRRLLTGIHSKLTALSSTRM
jgi:hypothetical protein